VLRSVPASTQKSIKQAQQRVKQHPLEPHSKFILDMLCEIPLSNFIVLRFQTKFPDIHTCILSNRLLFEVKCDK
jgi:hypothetical protein